MFRPLAFAVISIALATTAAAAPKTFEERASELVEQHFTALAAGDAKALAAIWSTNATVTSPTPSGKDRVVPIATLLPLWVEARDVRGWVRHANKRGDAVEVQAIVRWNNTFYRDRLIVTADKHGKLKIASKFTSPINRETPKRGYGG